MGCKIDDGELNKQTSCSFWSVDAPHKIEFFWVQQFWLQVDSDITGPYVTASGWYDAHMSATVSVNTQSYQPTSTHQYKFTSWISTGTNTAQITDPKSTSTTITMDNYYSVKAEWQEQWFIKVESERGNPTPSQWVNASQSLSVYVTSPTDDDGGGTRYRCKGYTIDDTGTQEGTSYTFSDVQGTHTIRFQWIRQYQLIIKINPAELSPQPIASPSGPWYAQGTTVTLTAQNIDGYTFDHWSVDGANQGNGISSIQVYMYEPQTATANYKPALFLTPLYPIVALVVVIAVLSVVILLVRHRRRKMF